MEILVRATMSLPGLAAGELAFVDPDRPENARYFMASPGQAPALVPVSEPVEAVPAEAPMQLGPFAQPGALLEPAPDFASGAAGATESPAGAAD